MTFVLVDGGHLRDGSEGSGLTAAPNHTELNGYDSWEVEAGNGVYEIQTGGFIVALAAANRGEARWKRAEVTTRIGQYVIADITSPAWTGNAVAGLEANGRWEAGDAIWAYIATNNYDVEHRSGSNTSTFPMTSGSITSGYPSNGTTITVCFGVHQQAPGASPLVGLCVNAPGNSRDHVLLEDVSALTGLNMNAVDVYPAIFQWSNVPGVTWQNISVFRDWALTIRGLDSTWGVKIVDSNYGTGTTFIAADANGEVRWTTPLGINPPIAYATDVTIYTDPGTWAAPLAGGHATLGDMDPGTTDGVFWPGAIVEWQTAASADRVGILINWENDDDWLSHAADDVTSVVKDIDLSVVAANPRIEVDTLTITLKDPFGDFVPANTNSLNYPNVRLGRELRWNLTVDGITVCRFHGGISEYTALTQAQSSTGEQQTRIRAESPLRALASAQTPLTQAPSGVLVNPDGVSGVIPTLLGIVPTIIPPETWALDPTPDSIPSGFLTDGMTIQTALEQCAIFADSIYFIRPHYRATPSPKFYFVWKARGVTSGATADHVWTDTGGSIGSIVPRYTGDII